MTSISAAIARVNDFLSGSIHGILSCHRFPHVSVINLLSSDESPLQHVLKYRMKAEHSTLSKPQKLTYFRFMSLIIVNLKQDKIFYKQKYVLH